MVVDTRIKEYIPFQVYPGGVCFTMDFLYEDLLDSFEKEDLEEWRIALEDIGPDMYKNWFCSKRVLENPDGHERTFFFLNIPCQFDFLDMNHYCMLAHELVHLCQFYLPDVLDRNVEHEAEAYFHTYMMETILRIIKEGKKDKLHFLLNPE